MQQSIHKFKVDENGKKVSMMAAVHFVGKRTWYSKNYGTAYRDGRGWYTWKNGKRRKK